MRDRQIITHIKDFLSGEGIEYFGVIPFRECRKRDNCARLLHFEPKSAIMFAVPYYVKPPQQRNISVYAAAPDYHAYFKGLFERIYEHIAALSSEFVMTGWCDHSPILEVEAAAKAGLGMIGDNGLLITPKFGSYVFIGELLTDCDCGRGDTTEIRHCSGCGLCRLNCPSPAGCLSELTQKKGLLTDDETELIKRQGCMWGCDICQSVCPHNMDIEETNIEYFRSDLSYNVTVKTLDEMSDEVFSTRAYSWRGRETIRRNALILESTDD